MSDIKEDTPDYVKRMALIEDVNIPPGKLNMRFCGFLRKIREQGNSFNEAAKRYVEHHTTSPEAANAAMVALGIQDEQGELTEPYKEFGYDHD